MPGKTYIAKQETSEAIQADTTAIRNTLGIFPGGIEDTVIGLLQELLTQPKGIRHIQRGVAQIAARSYDKSIDIQLSGFTDLNKMITVIDGNGGYTSADWCFAKLPYVSNLSVNALTVYYPHRDNTAPYNLDFGYQVIEYC